jgi:hypothetical protein
VPDQEIFVQHQIAFPSPLTVRALRSLLAAVPEDAILDILDAGEMLAVNWTHREPEASVE